MSSNSTPTILPSTAAPIVDDVFLRFKDAGRSTVIIAFTSIRIVMALACMLLNALLVYVTAKRRNLREIFNILIAWNSVACFCYMFAYVNHFIIAIFGWNFIPVRQCFFMMLLPIFAAQSLHVSFLAISTDRLLCVIFPLWHRNFLQANSKSYVILIICLVSLYSLIGLLSGIQYSQFVIPEKLVGCATSDGVPQIVFQVTLYYNILTLIFYILLWILMKFKNIGDSLSNTTKRTQKSLIIIFLIEFSGSFTNNLIKQITIWAALSAYDQWFVMNIAGLLLVPTLAMNAPVLFIRNMEYGRAFYKVFGIKFPFSKFVTSATITNGGKMVWTSNLNS